VPVMLLLLLVGPKLLPEYRDPDAGRIDLISVVLSLGSVLSVVYALKQIAEQGSSGRMLAVLVGGLAVGAWFVRRQSRLAYPLLDTRLFRQPAFSAAIAAYGLSCLAMFGVYIFITQYLQLVLGLSPLAAGVATVPWALGFVLGSLVAPRLARRWSALTVIVSGLAVAGAGFALLALIDARHALAMLVASTIVMSLGMAPVFTIGNEIIITAAPPERAGAASAISETASEFSGALGIAVFGSIGIALYRHTLVATLPADMPAAATDAAVATLGGAIAVAETLGGSTGPALAAAARAAFTDGLRLTAAMGALIVVVASIVAARMLRQRGPSEREARYARH
jgi:DHA2 family multidrug resistance protein-like MFS transporter